MPFPADRIPDPRREQETKDAAPPALPESARFEFTAGALGLFFRAVGLIFAMVLVVPAPWAHCWYARWFASRVRSSGGTALTFVGAPGGVAVLAVLLGVLLLASLIHAATADLPPPPDTWFGSLLLAIYGPNDVWNVTSSLAALPLGWALLRWLVNHTRLGGGSFRFEGSVWGYVGWYLLTHLSILTVVGWAWALAAFYRWMAQRTRHAEGTLEFVGRGHQFLWRLPVMFLFCLPLVTMPWALRWFTRWQIRQVEWRRGAPSQAG